MPGSAGGGPLPRRTSLTHSVCVRSVGSAARPIGPAAGYILSFFALAAAIGLRWALDPLMGETLPLVTLFGAVAVAIWLSGLTAAAIVTIVGYLVTSYFFSAPRGELGLSIPANLVGFAAYLFTCSLIIAIG